MKSKLEDFFSSPVKRGSDGSERRLGDTSLAFSEAVTLGGLVKGSGAVKLLEIGTALGASGVAMAEVLQLRGGEGLLVTLDPFQYVFGNVGIGEFARLGLEERVEFHAVAAEDYMAAAIKEGRFFDLILVDGPHSVGIKMTHTFFADQCLAPKGTMVFHDGFMPSTAACVKLLINEHGYTPLELPPDVGWKRWARVLKYAFVHGPRYALNVVRRSHRSLVALRKPETAPES